MIQHYVTAYPVGGNDLCTCNYSYFTPEFEKAGIPLCLSKLYPQRAQEGKQDWELPDSGCYTYRIIGSELVSCSIPS